MRVFFSLSLRPSLSRTLRNPLPLLKTSLQNQKEAVLIAIRHDLADHRELDLDEISLVK